MAAARVDQRSAEPVNGRPGSPGARGVGALRWTLPRLGRRSRCPGVREKVRDVVHLLKGHLLVFEAAEAAVAGAVLPGGAGAGPDEAQLGMGSDERLEAEGSERSAAVGDNGDQRLDAAGVVARGESRRARTRRCSPAPHGGQLTFRPNHPGEAPPPARRHMVCR